MSAQTGVAAPSGPVSSRVIDRARHRVQRLRTDPNPVWIRELRQSARLGRTPILLAITTAVLTLLIATIGGLVASSRDPAYTGLVLFHVFFSCAWFVVTLVGPAIAANGFAAEREGHTWEAVLLTGLTPQRIARGKFLAAFTALGSYLVMLAPVGALPFLFGGVTATEVVVAFAFLFLVALLSVAFGLALSSKTDRARTAILVTLLLSFPASLFSYLALGCGLSVGAHRLWPAIAEGPPVWLPLAYDRGEPSVIYFVTLFLLPVVAVTLPAWFLYEVTIANLSSVTDDRSTGLKRWFAVAGVVVALTAGAAPWLAAKTDRVTYTAIGASFFATFLAFAAFLFQGDPIGPSRRVLTRWARQGASRWRRFFGPSVVRAGLLWLVLAAFGFAVTLGGGALAILQVGTLKPKDELGLGVLAAYAIGFGVFTIGLATWLRTRTPTPALARVMFGGALFLIAAGPWIAAAIAGLATSGSGTDWMMIASPSPFFAFYAMAMAKKTSETSSVAAGIAVSAVWGGVGMMLLGAAERRARAIIRNHDAMLAKTERLLAEEDDAARAAEEAEAPPEGEGQESQAEPEVSS